MHRNFQLRIDRTLLTLFGFSPTTDDEYNQKVIGDVVSWVLEGSEYPDTLRWSCDFIRHLMGYGTPAEEDEFSQERTNISHQQSMRNRDPAFFPMSKKMSNILRHNTERQYFDERGTMELYELFNRLAFHVVSPLGTGNLTGKQFAAFLYSNDKARFQVDVHLNHTWTPYGTENQWPFTIRIGAIQGHSNETVDATVSYHTLTRDEAQSLGWVFHVTDSSNSRSITQHGLKRTPPKGSGKGGRDYVHFMYHNDNSPGYVKMAPGTQIPRHYAKPAYFVLDLTFMETNDIYLTKNGVVLSGVDVPARFLKRVEQLPTISINVEHIGRGHRLPSSVTGGCWTGGTSYRHVQKEKGSNFIPGGDVPDAIRTTAWQYMGQSTPENYGRLVFGLPLPLRNDFHPEQESIHGLFAGGSSASAEVPQDEAFAGGGSASVEVPKAHQTEEDTSRTPEDDTMDKEAVKQWEEDHGPAQADEEFTYRTTTSFASDNPWILYDTGVFCAKEKDGTIQRTSTGEKVIIIREWNQLLTNQRIVLRRQQITRLEWERLPWTGHLCYLFTRAWECGRYRSALFRFEKVSLTSVPTSWKSAGSMELIG
jgi:RNA:NAD 2'-phosphotransferase (TPT1/KptA family)